MLWKSRVQEKKPLLCFNPKPVLQTGEFDWSDNLQGVVLSAFSYGYISTQLIGGVLAGRFGAKKTMFVGIALSTVTTLLGPLAAIVSPYLLIGLQILNGLGQVRPLEHVTIAIPFQ